MRAVVSLLICCLGIGTALAQESSGGKKAVDALRPSGPVTVTADRAEFQQGGKMLYSGNVVLSSDTLKLSGNEVELTQLADGQYNAKILGELARLEHAAYTDSTGKAFPAVTAQARTLTYDSRTGAVNVSGSARMTRGTDEINGDAIRYNVIERRIEAAGGVRIVLQPPPAKDKKTTP